MTRIILIGLGVLSTGTAVYIWTATQHWYDKVPGVAATGPLNLHFAKDVALAYLASGGALIWAAVKSERSVGIVGAMWLVFHAVFHIGMWVHRGLPIDMVAATNLFGIQLPAFAALLAALKIQPREGEA